MWTGQRGGKGDNEGDILREGHQSRRISLLLVEMGPEQVTVKQSRGGNEVGEAHKANRFAKGARKRMNELYCRLQEVYEFPISISIVLKLVLSLLEYFEDAIRALELITEFILSEVNSCLLFVVV